MVVPGVQTVTWTNATLISLEPDTGPASITMGTLLIPVAAGGVISVPGTLPALEVAVEVEPNCAVLLPPLHDAISTDAMTSAASFSPQERDSGFKFKLMVSRLYL